MLAKTYGKIIRVRLENGVLKPVQKIEELVEGEEYIIHIIVPRKAQGLAKILEEHEEEIEFTIEEFEEFISTRR